MFKRFVAAACFFGTVGFSFADEVAFEVVGTFDRISAVGTDAFMEGDGFTLSVRYDDSVTGTVIGAGGPTEQTSYPAILAARLTTSRGLDTSITTGENSSVGLTQQTADLVFFSFADFDLSLDSSVPSVELGPFQLSLDFLMPQGSLGSQSLSDLASVLDSDVILSAPSVGAIGEGFSTVRFSDGGPLFAFASVESIESVRLVPEPETHGVALAACFGVLAMFRRRRGNGRDA